MAGPNSQTSTSKLWDLSLYESHRKPHDMVSDNTVIAVSPRAVHSELMCPICLDLMQNTQTTKECLHRFCQECIITALRSGNKECPTCRKKLVSKRSLRPDPNFDALIAKIYPNREELNAQQEKHSGRRSIPLPRRKRKAPETPPIDSNVPHPPEAKRRRPPGSEQGSPAPSLGLPTRTPTPTPTPPQPADQVKPDEEVELQLRPLPADPSVTEHAIRNLVTSHVCTVSHLVKYLSIHPLLEKDVKEKGAIRALNFNESKDQVGGGDDVERNVRLYAQLGASDDYCALPGATSLQQIVETYWTPGDKLKLFFANGRHSSNTSA